MTHSPDYYQTIVEMLIVILTVCLDLNISGRTLTQVIGGSTTVGPRICPGHDAYVQDGEVAQDPPVPLLPPGDLRLGVGVNLALEGHGVVVLHHGSRG